MVANLDEIPDDAVLGLPADVQKAEEKFIKAVEKLPEDEKNGKTE
jgi:diacylglycerol kinase (ATP)